MAIADWSEMAFRRVNMLCMDLASYIMSAVQTELYVSCSYLLLGLLSRALNSHCSTLCGDWPTNFDSKKYSDAFEAYRSRVPFRKFCLGGGGGEGGGGKLGLRIPSYKGERSC